MQAPAAQPGGSDRQAADPAVSQGESGRCPALWQVVRMLAAWLNWGIDDSRAATTTFEDMHARPFIARVQFEA